jgi:hypothetical protein
VCAYVLKTFFSNDFQPYLSLSAILVCAPMRLLIRVGRDMARKIGRLTALAVSRLSEPGMHPDGGGLYLQISKTGARSWVFRFKKDGHERYMGLGPFHAVSLADARQKAPSPTLQITGKKRWKRTSFR